MIFPIFAFLSDKKRYDHVAENTDIIPGDSNGPDRIALFQQVRYGFRRGRKHHTLPF